MYPMDYIWLLIVALGVISSIMNKGKDKSKGNPSSMPTFGGGGERSLRPAPTVQNNDTNTRIPTKIDAEQEVNTQRSTLSLPVPKSDERSVKDIPTYHESGEGVSQMWEDRIEEVEINMQRDIDRMTARLDNISATSSDEWNVYDIPNSESKDVNASRMAQQAVTGLIWSEILGPPRAKRSYSKRRS
ncbi:hypothetical protein D3C76_1148130 [compost metagenome]